MHRSKFQILLSFILLFNIAEHLWHQQACIDDDPIEILQEEISESAEETSENNDADKLDSFNGDGLLNSHLSSSFLKSFFNSSSIAQICNSPIPKLYILYVQLKICAA